MLPANLSFASKQHQQVMGLFMLWFIVDPFRYAFLLLGTTVVLTTLLAPKLNWKRGKTFFFSLFCSILLFVPVAFGIGKVMDQFRFGVFQYENHEAIRSQKISRWLPPDATNLAVKQDIGGFEAKYFIRLSDLEAWLDRYWEEHGTGVNMSNRSREEEQGVVEYIDEEEAAKLGWTFPSDATRYPGPSASDWGGFTIWYSKAEGVAYQHAGYW